MKMRSQLVLAFCISTFAIAVHGLEKDKDLDLLSIAKAIIEKQGVVPRQSNMNTEDEKKVLNVLKELFTTKDDLWVITYNCKEKIERLLNEKYACAIYLRDPGQIWYNQDKFVIVDLGQLRINIFRFGTVSETIKARISRRQNYGAM